MEKAAAVEAACKHCTTHLRTAKGNKAANDAEGRFKRLQDNINFGKISLDKLSPIEVKAKLDKQTLKCGVDDDKVSSSKSAHSCWISLLLQLLRTAFLHWRDPGHATGDCYRPH
ncbi:MAG: hypothetical protein EPO09_05425 [Aquabacterium sp.]|uniref:hypothetical protein n=1 Tax=Aquabacterium sp. TaxID=1872578 RepID=UPI001200AFF6|nr:hypothetical protein [Aquabacterium sp.]TAK96785.1 MAG: hypothetical protein EPO09_05425 [Aquabacterium sp.]